MAESARLESIDVLLNLKVALTRFTETVSAALVSAESDMQRTLGWLEQDQQMHWKGQIRLWHERLHTAMSKLSEKRIFKNVDGTTPSTVDEERAVQLARQRHTQAEEKLALVKRWTLRLRKEMDQFRAGTNGLRIALSIDVPLGQARLERMAGLLQQYIDVSSSARNLTEIWREAVGSVARPLPTEQPPATDEPSAEAVDETNPPGPGEER